MVFDFLHFVFFQVQYIHYCWKHYIERLLTIYTHFFKEVINKKENNEVGTICFEISIPMKKQKYLWNFSYKFTKIIIYIWIQQSYFGRKQKYLWKRFNTVKKATEK